MVLLTEKNYHNYIHADKVVLGSNVVVGKDVVIKNIDGTNAKYIEIGDNVFIGDNTLILLPKLKIGDYVTIHKNNRISGYKQCKIGHNFWIDQNCILNATDELIIGNNVGIGAYSQLWTHIKFGDVMEGCQFNMKKKMIIEDDVWFVGHCIVSPIHAEAKSMAMVGSVITKDMKCNHIYAGVPAKDMTEKFGTQFIERNYEEKNKFFVSRLEQFYELNQLDIDFIQPVKKYPSILEPDIIYFNLMDRTYTKKRTEIETKFMKFLLPEIKFIPKT